MTNTKNNFFDNQVMGHPAGLFVLFFTEMWERFSYYGMRALLVLFLTAKLIENGGGWGWDNETAMSLYGSYTSLAYLTPILGGYIADKFIGYRWAIIIGALIMTLGHVSMAVELHPIFMYLGLILLVIGNGFFKPNMTSIVSNMYKNHPEKKDGAYTIFYMGVNSGAFLGMLLCGYVGETYKWSYGFGLAGIFMLIGMLQFYFTQNIFANIGLKPNDYKSLAVIKKEDDKNERFEIFEAELNNHDIDENKDKRNPFTLFQKILMIFIGFIGVTWVINDPINKILKAFNFFWFDFSIGNFSGSIIMIILALFGFIILLLNRISKYEPIVRDRMFAVVCLAFITIFFWGAFEQAGGSMTIFASKYTNRVLVDTSKIIFNIVNTLITVIPMLFISYVLIKLFLKTFQKYALGNIILAFGFLIIWGILIFMLIAQYKSEKSEVPATWFGIFNSLFIITLAPIVSKIWESKFNPFATFKYGFGMILLAIGFAILAFASMSIPVGAKTASVSMLFLIFTYLFHTLGELFISPVGLSYVSKLVPSRMIAMMFGVWYLAIALGNKLAGTMGGYIDEITTKYSMTMFFLIFTIVPTVLGIFIIALTPVLKKLMHGIK